MKIDKSLLSGSTTLLVLSLLAEGEKYGYQMIQELAAKSDNTFQMKEGTLYPILRGLENSGAVTAYRQVSPAGRERKYYHLTEKGRKQLAEETRQWRAYEGAINAVLNMG